MSTLAPRPILVGLDGSNHSSRALDWAIAEATSRKLPLHLVHALETGVTVWSPMMVVPTDLGDQRWILETALQHIRKAAPELSITSAITSGPASTALHVVSHAHSPVVVVREESSDAEAWKAECVVVGFDGSHLSDDALAFAF